ncbi:MAG TPA: YHS domain-containing protein [Saprospirales bacterium]|nr:YHS domain-containing protein [Saprospirales bacterium]
MKPISFFTACCLALFMLACQQNAPKVNTPTAAAAGPDLPWATDLDLVCEMKVDKTVEDTVHYHGKVYGFCNAGCKETFLENPGKYGAQ